MELKYKFSNPMLGIDVSKYQGNINWEKVKLSGYNYVFVRLGYANNDGTIVIDPYFDRNMLGAIAAGLETGVYLYSYIDSVAHAQIAATKVLELIDEYNITMPVAFDYEHSAKYASYGRDKNTEICNAFMKVISNGGYLPMYYSYTSFVNSYMNMADLNKYEGLWIANYTGKIGVDDTAIWQYSSSGNVNGIAGRVDMNRMYCDIPRIVKESYNPKAKVEFTTISGQNLDVFAEGKCEYFTGPSIYNYVMNADGKTDKLPVGEYKVTGIADKLCDGYQMVQIEYNGKTVYAAVLDDRCRLVVSKDENCLKATIYPCPNEGDRNNLVKYAESLGFKIEFNW